MRIYIHVYLYMYHICTQIYTYMYTNTYIYVHNKHTCTHVHNKCTYICKFVYIRSHVCTYIHITWVYISVYKGRASPYLTGPGTGYRMVPADYELAHDDLMFLLMYWQKDLASTTRAKSKNSRARDLLEELWVVAPACTRSVVVAYTSYAARFNGRQDISF